MDAAEDSPAKTVEQFGDGFVGLDHEHFDHGVRVGLVGRDRVGDLVGVVEDQFDLGQVEVEHTGLSAAGFDELGQALGVAHEGNYPPVESADLAVADALGVKVRQPGGGADDRFGELTGDDFAGVVVRNERALAVPPPALLEGTGPIGQRRRQHRQHLAGEVHAGGPPAGRQRPADCPR